MRVTEQRRNVLAFDTQSVRALVLVLRSAFSGSRQIALAAVKALWLITSCAEKKLGRPNLALANDDDDDDEDDEKGEKLYDDEETEDEDVKDDDDDDEEDDGALPSPPSCPSSRLSASSVDWCAEVCVRSTRSSST